jgi:hypothetical protein
MMSQFPLAKALTVRTSYVPYTAIFMRVHLKNIVRPPKHLHPSVPAHGHGSSTGSNVMVEEESFPPHENFTPQNVPRPARFCPYTAIYFRNNVQSTGRIDLIVPARGHDGSTVSNVVVTPRNVSGAIHQVSAVTNSSDRKARGIEPPHIVQEIPVLPCGYLSHTTGRVPHMSALMR